MQCQILDRPMRVTGNFLLVGEAQRSKIQAAIDELEIIVEWLVSGYGIASYREDSQILSGVDLWSLFIASSDDAGKLQAWLDAHDANPH